jgi:hypothetical protein
MTVLASVNPAVSIVVIVLGIIAIVANWIIFTKAGRHGWESIIPFWNLYVLLHIIGKSGWNMLWYLLPIVGWLILAIILCIGLARSFGHGGGFAVGLFFLPWIFECILAFGDSEYLGPGGDRNAVSTV